MFPSTLILILGLGLLGVLVTALVVVVGAALADWEASIHRRRQDLSSRRAALAARRARRHDGPPEAAG